METIKRFDIYITNFIGVGLGWQKYNDGVIFTVYIMFVTFQFYTGTIEHKGRLKKPLFEFRIKPCLTASVGNWTIAINNPFNKSRWFSRQVVGSDSLERYTVDTAIGFVWIVYHTGLPVLQGISGGKKKDSKKSKKKNNKKRGK